MLKLYWCKECKIMVYLIRQEIRNGSYFKVGYATNMSRFKAYATHNANVELLEIIPTYSKTKHNLETLIHNELIALGYEFAINQNNNRKEFFFVSIENEQEFINKGLSQFKACKNRKIIKIAQSI